MEIQFFPGLGEHQKKFFLSTVRGSQALEISPYTYTKYSDGDRRQPL